MSRTTAAFVTFLALTGVAQAQNPLTRASDAFEIRFTRSQPVIGYTLRVDSTDLTAIQVEMRIRNAPDTFHLAMVAHPEYDDRYWRYVEGLRAEAVGGGALVAREDSALWRVSAPGGEVVVRYRVRLPAPESPRGAWRPFLSPTGGLVGGTQSFMYIVGATLAPSHVALELPPGWEIATGLEPTADPRIFFAPSVAVLIDSPALVGHFRTWRFLVDGVPHRVVYWPLPDAAPFDTTALVSSLERLVRQAVALFGRAPYREYTFLFQDGAYGALEHRNSVTIGAPSAELAKSLDDLFGETAHEYFHTWNLMRIHPVEHGDVDYRTPAGSRGLWWSEGLTMYYSDLLRRRAGLPVPDSTRIAHLETQIGYYLRNPGNSRFSPEQVSLSAFSESPGAFGDYSPSTHLQGELLGTLLDLIVRDATRGRRSIDDVMRAMLEQFSGERGFTGRDIERIVGEVCGCQVKPFFDAHVRGAKAIDFDQYLRLAGLRTRVSWSSALDQDGQPLVDQRLYAWLAPGERLLSLLSTNPASAWGLAGLHTGDRLISLGGVSVTREDDFRARIRRLRIGDTVQVTVRRPPGEWRTTVVAVGFDRPVVRIEEFPEATERQRATRVRWVAGSP